jgi:hypothetical protein
MFHHALKHSNASIMLSPREFLSRGDERLSTAKGSLAFAGCCWVGKYIEGLTLQGREGFFYIWLTPPSYRIKPLSGGNSRAGVGPGLA